MNTYFKLSDFIRVWHKGKWETMPLPQRAILNQVVENHFLPINEVRSNLGIALKVHRCYATEQWEELQGRDGTSQHCFNEHDFGDRIGACDIDFWNATDGSKKNYLRFAYHLIRSPYKRICWYPDLTFFHNDYKANNRQFFIQRDGEWDYVSTEDKWLTEIEKSF